MLKEVWDIRTQSATLTQELTAKHCSTMSKCLFFAKNEIRTIVNSFHIKFGARDLVVEP